MTSNLSCMASIAHIPMTFWPPNASTNISLAEKHKCVYPSIPLMGWRNIIIHWPSVFDRGKKKFDTQCEGRGEPLFRAS